MTEQLKITPEEEIRMFILKQVTKLADAKCIDKNQFASTLMVLYKWVREGRELEQVK